MESNTYYGACEWALADRGLRLSMTRYGRDAIIPVHAHERAYLIIATAGGFHEKAGRAAHDVGTHDLVYHPPGHNHGDQFLHGGGRCLNIEMDAGRWEHLHWNSAAGTDPIYARDPDMRRIGRALLRELALVDARGVSLATEELLGTLLSKLRGPTRRRHGQPPRWLLQVRDRLRAHYADAHRLETLAAMVDVHPVHLAREFRRQFGCSVQVYLRRCRIAHAQRLLATSERPLVDIALELGYGSQSHFTRAFHATTGMAPGLWRRQWQRRKR